ncbi:hypothetical protein ACWT_4787 [Actinoplanes sp. SE50]|uniref:hypothetical protein n=1 Tax=unclassified Actinoplanes TaxID=2626549 RepID=UPI00023EC2E8|nr:MULTISPECIES: hypothetical protein [unclassified Actinoplanes]AEV85808.1 hypothetical protein ACPL_4917 [Actinoplanes sp. SE50/110]ATO84202.1 hypothetical protein ACWT_4787 [Actinoplanes sp. SE50]SLM01612.1 hypothetical protein ACSP50_4848 [Actinoplanes sp. SE50/110]
MTERIRELLDEAVAELEPGYRDPVATVVRRGRAARRRTMLAATLAVMLLAGGLVAGRQMLAGPLTPTAAGTADSRPRLVDGKVRAGAVEIPVPAGWRVVTNDASQPCGDLTETIMLIVRNNRGCQYAPMEISVAAGRNPGGTVLFTAAEPFSSGDLITTPRSVTLAGGEPGWMPSSPEDAELAPGREGYHYSAELLLPWSDVFIQFRTDGPTARRILETFRSTPREGGALKVPTRVGSVDLTMPDSSGRLRPAGHGISSDPKTVNAVLGLLREQTAVVRDGDACAGTQQLSARLSLIAPGPSPSPSPDAMSFPVSSPKTTTVVIALGTKCQEAVSSDGGRVLLSDTALARLQGLMGIGAR